MQRIQTCTYVCVYCIYVLCIYLCIYKYNRNLYHCYVFFLIWQRHGKGCFCCINLLPIIYVEAAAELNGSTFRSFFNFCTTILCPFVSWRVRPKQSPPTKITMLNNSWSGEELHNNLGDFRRLNYYLWHEKLRTNLTTKPFFGQNSQ